MKAVLLGFAMSAVFASSVADAQSTFRGDDGNGYAVDPADGHQLWRRRTGGPVAATPAIADGVLYVVSYDGKFYALDARTGAPRWKFATGGERRFEAKGLHGMQPKNQTIADPFDVYLSSPVVGGGSVYFGSGDGNVYALDAVSGDLQWKFATGDVVHASPAYADGVLFFGSWDSYFYAVDARTGKEKWRFHGGEDPVIHNQVGFQSSPAVVNGVVYTGCRDSNLLEARDLDSGILLWEFATEASTRNDGWVLTADRQFNAPLLYWSNWREVPIAATVAQFGVGSIFSSPLVVGGVVYFGSSDGNLYALE